MDLCYSWLGQCTAADQLQVLYWLLDVWFSNWCLEGQGHVLLLFTGMGNIQAAAMAQLHGMHVQDVQSLGALTRVEA